jgi:hypothetical protein
LLKEEFNLTEIKYWIDLDWNDFVALMFKMMSEFFHQVLISVRLKLAGADKLAG